MTGGAGFIGANFVRKLYENDIEPIVIDDFSSGLLSNIDDLSCEVIDGNILNLELLKSVVSRVDQVVHLAARGSVPRSILDPITTFHVNTQGTFHVLEAARENDVPVIFSSSSSVYGANLSLPKNEYSWMNPMTPYAASKLSGESMCSSYGSSYGIPMLILRFFNVYGPHQRPDHEYSAVIPRWIWSALSGRKITVFGDGAQSRDFTYVGDVCEILLQSCLRNITSNHPVNLAFGEKIRLVEVIDEIRRYFPDFEVQYEKERNGDIRDSQNDPTRLKEHFPNIDPTPFASGFMDTMNWIKSYFNASLSVKSVENKQRN